MTEQSSKHSSTELEELRKQQQRAHETIRSWPDYMKLNIIVTASNGGHYLLRDIDSLVRKGHLEPQPQLSGLISLLPEKAA